MSHFIELAKSRFSARQFVDRNVEKEILDKILEAARIAPTAANKQPVKIYVFRTGEIREKMNATYPREWIKPAPVLLLITALNNEAWHHPKTEKSAGTVDASIVIDHMTLAATSVGLSTCWICNFDVEACSQMLDLPESEEPIALLPLGYSNQTADLERHQSGRKSLEQMVKFM